MWRACGGVFGTGLRHEKEHDELYRLVVERVEVDALGGAASAPTTSKSNRSRRAECRCEADARDIEVSRF